MKDVREALMVAKASDGRLVRRPLSPHLQIYRWPITMAASILHRATGVALSAGALILVWWLVAAASSPKSFAAVQWFLGSWLGVLMLFGWTASLFYHLFSGLRHLAWDHGYGFEHETLNPSSRVVMIAAAAATLLVWLVGLIIW
ncbi:MAG TPA: succinate dehydrogenase, cytochrome b556 subunit [Acetobacteraceae bacterium]|nr:succinate dehydrogenase, cytochrome b556 subunit [Acetobacteraceae bacterium]